MRSKPFALSVKVAVLDAKDRCLVLRRSSTSKNNAGSWDFPGGKVDAGEAFDEALIREVSEETGLSISLAAVAGAAESELPDKKIAYLIFEGRASEGEVQLSSEHSEFRWASRKEMAGMNFCPQFVAFAKSWAQGPNDSKTEITATGSEDH